MPRVNITRHIDISHRISIFTVVFISLTFRYYSKASYMELKENVGYVWQHFVIMKQIKLQFVIV